MIYVLRFESNLNMVDDIDTQLKAGIRKIRNIEFNYDDCEALLNPGTKLKGTAINALGALFQQQAERDPEGIPDWCIFSSWLGDIVRGQAPKVIGTIGDHVKAAVSSFLIRHTVGVMTRTGSALLQWVN